MTQISPELDFITVCQRRRLIPKSATQSVRGRSWRQPRRWTGPSGSSTSKVDSKKCLTERERPKLETTSKVDMFVRFVNVEGGTIL
jgi:hypothetical protein